MDNVIVTADSGKIRKEKERYSYLISLDKSKVAWSYKREKIAERAMMVHNMKGHGG